MTFHRSIRAAPASQVVEYTSQRGASDGSVTCVWEDTANIHQLGRQWLRYQLKSTLLWNFQSLILNKWGFHHCPWDVNREIYPSNFDTVSNGKKGPSGVSKHEVNNWSIEKGLRQLLAKKTKFSQWEFLAGRMDCEMESEGLPYMLSSVLGSTCHIFQFFTVHSHKGHFGTQKRSSKGRRKDFVWDVVSTEYWPHKIESSNYAKLKRGTNEKICARQCMYGYAWLLHGYVQLCMANVCVAMYGYVSMAATFMAIYGLPTK